MQIPVIDPLHARCSMQKKPLRAHGFYRRTVREAGYDGAIRVRRYLCLACCRTVSLLPEFVLPYLRFGIAVIGPFLKARLLVCRTLKSAAMVAGDPGMPYQRGQAAALAAALVALTRPPTAPGLVARALAMIETTGCVAAHRFLFGRLHMHLLGRPPFLAPEGWRCAL